MNANEIKIVFTLEQVNAVLQRLGMMKKYILGVVLTLASAAAVAACYTNTFIGTDGRMVVLVVVTDT